jgi:hypothetical protein
MWRGYEEALASYGVAVCREWTRQGYADTCLAKLVADFGRLPRTQPELRRAAALPYWLGQRAVHLSHRSSLLRKDFSYYSAQFPDVPDDLEYVWPAPAPGRAPRA